MVKFTEIKDELLNDLKNENLISKADRGVSTDTDLFSGNTSDTSFILTGNYSININNISNWSFYIKYCG